ncbi:MAG: hypothetical protein AB1439_06970 [candidate division FCPU426 bacterium]
MLSQLSRRATVALGVGLLALLLQWLVLAYLNQLSQSQFADTSRKLLTQIARDLGDQLSRALTAGDDLAALSVLKAGRNIHPQLQKAEVFDRQGKIILHSDPGMLGQKTRSLSGPRPMVPELSLARQEGRPFAVVLVPLPHDEDLLLRAYFDETSMLQSRRVYIVRFYVLLLLTSLLLSLFVYFRLGRFELLDPRERAENSPSAGAALPARLAGLLLADFPAAALAVNRNNRIVAGNALACELLNCRPEELEGLHVLQAPLPAGLQELYREALRTPERGAEAKLNLKPKEPGLLVKIRCTPASADWELALVQLG